MEDKKPKAGLLKYLGPGLISGAADDDPSGIATYTIAGARYGTQFLWTAFLTWPLMAVVQMACAQVAIATEHGLARAFAQKIPKWSLILLLLALLGANILNIAADLIAMSEATEALTGLPSFVVVAFFCASISWFTVNFKYRQISNSLKWLTFSLFAYIAVVFLSDVEWTQVLRATFSIHIPKNSSTWGILVGLLGTTITPFLFFWQASLEVEEQKEKHGNLPPVETRIAERRIDVWVGCFFSNLVMFFIILAAAVTLHSQGAEIETSKQAAEALLPVAGRGAFLLYSIGIIGTGLLAIPPLATSTAYALCETFHWKSGLNNRFRRAQAFYLIIVISLVLASVLDFGNFSPLKMLYWSAVTNGLVAPILIFILWLVTKDAKIMKANKVNRLRQNVLLLTALLMAAAAFGMFMT